MTITTVIPHLTLDDLSPSERDAVLACVERPRYWDTDKLYRLCEQFRNNHPYLARQRAEAKTQGKSFYFSETRLLEEAEYLLTQAGFVKFHETLGPRIEAQHFDLRELSDDSFQLWAHPAGVLATLDSTGGNKSGPLRYNNISVHAQIDLGMGNILNHLGSYQTSGSSGGKEFHPEGNWTYRTWTQCPSRCTELLGFLEGIQVVGRLLPFDEWDPREGPYSYVHQWLPATDPASPSSVVSKWMEQDPQLTHRQASARIFSADEGQEIAENMARATWQHILAILPTFDQVFPGLTAVMAASAYRPLGLDSRNSDNSISWDRVIKEEGQRHGVTYGARYEMDGPHLPMKKKWDSRRVDASKALLQDHASMSLVRFIGPQEQQRIKHWMEVCASLPATAYTGDHFPPFEGTISSSPTNIDWNNVDYAAVSELSITLPALLLEDSAFHPSSITALVELLNHASPDQVHQWCTTPDQEGLTLPLRMLKVCLNADLYASNHKFNQVVHVLPQLLQVLEQRCPSAEWVMETERATPYGLWFREETNKSKYEKTLSFEEYESVLEQLENIGVAIPRAVTWFLPLRSATDDASSGHLSPATTWSYASLSQACDATQIPITHGLSRLILQEHTNDALEDKEQRRPLKM